MERLKVLSWALLCIAVALCAAILWAVCIYPGYHGHDLPSSKDKLVIGFVEMASESEWRDKVNQSVREAAEHYNVQLLVLKSERSVEAQREAVRALVAYKVDAIVFSPLNITGWDNVVTEAKNAGIPIVLSGRNIVTKVPGAIYAFVGSSYERQGELIAKYIEQCYSEKNGQVNIVEMSGTVGSSDSIELSRGIRKIFDYLPRFDIYYVASADGLFSKSKELLDSFLRNNQDERKTDVFIGYSDAITLGAIEAMDENGIQAGEDIIVVSIGGEDAALELLRQGKINCVIKANYNLGDSLMQACIDITQGREVPLNIYLEDVVFTRDALADASHEG